MNKKTKDKATDGDRKIGLKLKALRKKAELSQSELASHLGVTFQQIQKYEKGLNRIPAIRLFTISKLFDVDLAYFFEDLERPFDQHLVKFKKSHPIQKFRGVLPKDNLRFELNIFDHKTSNPQA